jgi:hypothetical protein
MSGRAQGVALEEPAAVILHGGSVKGENQASHGALNGHEAGNAGQSQREPTALLGLLYSEILKHYVLSSLLPEQEVLQYRYPQTQFAGIPGRNPYLQSSHSTVSRPWLLRTKVYPGVGADMVMESISLIDY